MELGFAPNGRGGQNGALFDHRAFIVTPNLEMMQRNKPTPSESKRSGEFAQLIRLALPLMGAQLAQMGMGVVDTVMAGRVGAVDLAGVALGGSVLWPVMLLSMGFLQAITPTVAQLNGAKRQGEIGEYIRQGLWLAIVSTIVICLVITNAGPYYAFMGVAPDAVAVALPYLAATAWGIPALMGYFTLRFLAEGLGFTRPALFIAVTALLLKIPLNYLFIYGGPGIPAMGGVGCGYATAIVMWVELIAIVIVVTRQRFHPVGWIDRFSWPQWEKIQHLMVIGLPIGATLFFEVGFFTFVTILLGRFGAEIVASHTIAMNLGGITFMFPLALGMAATIRVGFNIGAGRPDLARRTAQVAVASTVIIAMFCALIVVIGREVIADLYTNDVTVLALAAELMLFVAVFQLFDNCQATAIGALRGYKDTRVPMLMTLIGYWFIGLPVAATLGFGWLGNPLGVHGFWYGLIVSLICVAAMVVSRLFFVARRSL
ncbi:MAG: MATE family efflux transporter [Pseudomonadales bacterium]